MKNIIALCLMLVLVSSFMISLTAQPVAATDFKTELTNNLNSVGGTAYDTEDPTPLPEMVGNIIKVVLTFLGVVVIVIVIYAGFLWMTAGGNPEDVTKAKQWLTNAVIGLAIILAAYAITNFVITSLLDATTGN